MTFVVYNGFQLRADHHLFHEQVTYQTELGQLIDLITAPEDSVDLSKFSLEK